MYASPVWPLRPDCARALAYVARGGWDGLAHEIARLSPWRSAGYVSRPCRFCGLRTAPLPLWNDFVTCLFLAVLGAFWSSLPANVHVVQERPPVRLDRCPRRGHVRTGPVCHFTSR